MKVAIISDIHGNLVSLNAVLTDIKRQGVDDIICLGDVATLGPQPSEVIQRLMTLDCQFIMGNHETYLFDIEQGRAYMNETWFINALTWCLERLSEDELNFLRTFHPILKFRLDSQKTIISYHGSPRSNEENILPTTPNEDLEKMLAGYHGTVMMGGHTHVQLIRSFNGRLILNPGSVGMPFEAMPFIHSPRVLPWAEYAILSFNHGVLGVDLRRVPINMRLVKEAALKAQMPETSEWMQNWISIQQLATTGHLLPVTAPHKPSTDNFKNSLK